MATNDILRAIYLFKDFSPTEISAMVEICEEKVFEPANIIFVEGSVADALYVIKKGSVRVRQKTKDGNNAEIAQLSTGSHFGEVSFFDGGKRSATVEAFEFLEVFKMDYEKVRAVLAKDSSTAAKFYKSLASFLCGRLRVTTSDLSYTKERLLHLF